MNEDPTEAPGPALERVSCHEGLVKVLAEQFARADVSLRELQARADRAGGARLPRATCADMLAGRRFPKKAVMVAFLRACRVPEQQIPAWERAWERVRVTRMPAGPADEPRPGPLTAEPAPGRRRRHAVVLAAALALLAATAVGVVLALTAAPRGGGSEALPGRTLAPGHIVSDDGRAFPRGGLSRFTVTVDPGNTGVRLIRRLDVGVPLQHATITVNGAPAQEWRPLLGDDVYKWRNQIVELPPALTAGRRTLTIVNTSVSSSGFNEFLYTVEQKMHGVWEIADTVDIGPGHTASEAAHDYRNVGEDWADTQTFAYPPHPEDWNVE
ncbi:hypothetical protein [Nonomuraea sp. SBT364]|uniref:hypothetical protein n=1 Tax=Nonomuraea sp. SBT364 TaxID=1580530 RepID=UPI00066AD99A|nr:hypothetical protein [Nonomuraea sp. SBT364]